MTQPIPLHKTLCIIASSLLLFIAAFHGSGIYYINNLVQASDTPDLIKSIFPVLFILPTIQLIGLATFGFIAATMKDQANKILIPLSIFVFLDAVFAFYLGAILPGLVLSIPAFLFLFIAYHNRTSA